KDGVWLQRNMGSEAAKGLSYVAMDLSEMLKRKPKNRDLFATNQWLELRKLLERLSPGDVDRIEKGTFSTWRPLDKKVLGLIRREIQQLKSNGHKWDLYEHFFDGAGGQLREVESPEKTA